MCTLSNFSPQNTIFVFSRYSSSETKILCEHTSHIVHCFSFFPTNIEAYIIKKDIFKIYISLLVTAFWAIGGTFIDLLKNYRSCLWLGVK